jgi:membrane-associated phospholipid phosphatase
MVLAVSPSRRLRFPPAAWLVAIGALLLAGALMLGVRLQDLVGPTRLDRVAANELVSRGVHNLADRQVWKDVVSLAGLRSVVGATALLIWWAARRRDMTGIVVAIVGPALTIVGVEFLAKPLVERRTPTGGLEYPSGHVAAGVALATVALLLVYRYVGPRRALLLTPVAVVGAGVVGVGVLVLHWHYLTDTVGGVAVGAGVVLCVAGVADLVASRSGAGFSTRSVASPSLNDG